MGKVQNILKNTPHYKVPLRGGRVVAVPVSQINSVIRGERKFSDLPEHEELLIAILRGWRAWVEDIKYTDET